jgi:hypothetical protein
MGLYLVYRKGNGARLQRSDKMTKEIEIILHQSGKKIVVKSSGHIFVAGKQFAIGSELSVDPEHGNILKFANVKARITEEQANQIKELFADRENEVKEQTEAYLKSGQHFHDEFCRRFYAKNSDL